MGGRVVRRCKMGGRMGNAVRVHALKCPVHTCSGVYWCMCA